MEPVLSLDRVQLREVVAPLTLAARTGECIALLSPSEAVVAELLQVLGGIREPQSGQVYRRAEVWYAPGSSPRTRATVYGYLQELVGKKSTGALLSHVMILCGLDSARKKLVTDLKPSEALRLELATAILLKPPVIVFDHNLDGLDPWQLQQVVAELKQTRSTVIVATKRLDVIEFLDHLWVIHPVGLAYAGSLYDLRRSLLPIRYEVFASDKSAAIAVAKRFVVDILETENGFEFSSREGQGVAAKLLTHGYGSIQAVRERAPTLMESLQYVIETAETGLPVSPERPVHLN